MCYYLLSGRVKPAVYKTLVKRGRLGFWLEDTYLESLGLSRDDAILALADPVELNKAERIRQDHLLRPREQPDADVTDEPINISVPMDVQNDE